MTTRLPAGSETPVPLGRLSSPWPGAQALSHGVLEIWSSPVLGMGVSPKQVHPFPPTLSASAVAARSGGTRNKMAWWSSTLPGKNWLEMMYEFCLTCGFITVQW